MRFPQIGALAREKEREREAKKFLYFII